MTTLRMFTLVVLGLFASISLMAQTTAASPKEKKIRDLLALMKAGDMGVQVIDGMIGTMTSSIPDVPAEFWTGFRQQVRASDLVDLLVPVYARNLSEADVDELTRFYSSPAGRRFIEKQPVILQESMVVGRKWGEEMAQKAIDEIRRKGYGKKR